MPKFCQSRDNGYYPDIYFQRYNSSGIAQGINLKVNDDPGTAARANPSIAINRSGKFIIVREDFRNGDPEIYYQRYDSAGTAQGINIKVSDDISTAFQEYPSVIMNESGDFVIIWQDERHGNTDIYYQMYNSSGVAQGCNKKVNEDNSTIDHKYPSVATDESGNFVIAWEDWRNGNPDIYFQWYNSAQGSIVKSNDDTGTAFQRIPAIAINDKGNFVIVWGDYRFGWDNPDVIGQRYHSDRSPWGVNYRIVVDGPNFGEKAPVTVTSSGTIIFSWIDNREITNGRWNVFGKVTTWDWEGEVSVKEQPDGNASKPKSVLLSQNYPNPFNPSTTIEFSLPKSAFVTLKVFNLLGEEVATLVAEQRTAGIHKLNWDARGLASGVYLYRLEAGDFMQMRKLILMK